MQFSVEIFREDEDPEMLGKMCVTVGIENSSPCKYFVSDVKGAAEAVKDFILSNADDDGASVCWKPEIKNG